MRGVLLLGVLTLIPAQQALAGTATATVTGTISGGYSVKYLNGEETFLRYYDGEPFKIVFQIDYDKPGAQRTVYTLEEDGEYGERVAGAVSGSGSIGEGYEIPVSATFESPYDSFSASGNYLGYALIVGFRGPGQIFEANVADAFEQIEPGYESWKSLTMGVSGFLPVGSALNPLGRLNVPFESDIANSTFSYLYYTHQYYIWDDGYFNDVRLDLNIQHIKYVVNNSVVPEPSTWAMLLLGFGAVGWTLRRPLSSSARHKGHS